MILSVRALMDTGQGAARQSWNVHQLLQRLRNVDVLDGVSQNSAEDGGSNTDSGRGASEPDAGAAAGAGGTATEHNGGGAARQQCSSENGTRTAVANHYGQCIQWRHLASPTATFCSRCQPPLAAKATHRVIGYFAALLSSPPRGDPEYHVWEA